MQSCRPVVQPNSSFLAQLQAFAAQAEQGRDQPAALATAATAAEKEDEESADSEAAEGRSSSSRKRPIHLISAAAPLEEYGPALGPTTRPDNRESEETT